MHYRCNIFLGDKYLMDYTSTGLAPVLNIPRIGETVVVGDTKLTVIDVEYSWPNSQSMRVDVTTKVKK